MHSLLYQDVARLDAKQVEEMADLGRVGPAQLFKAPGGNGGHRALHSLELDESAPQPKVHADTHKPSLNRAAHPPGEKGHRGIIVVVFPNSK